MIEITYDFYIISIMIAMGFGYFTGYLAHGVGK